MSRKFLGSVYTNAISNRHGFMPLKPQQKRYGFKTFTRCQSHRFQVRYGDLVPRHSLLRKGIWVRLLLCHFVFVKMAKNSTHFTWTDDEVGLLLKVTNEYKVSAALRVRFTVRFESSRPSEISRKNSNLIQIYRCGFAV